MRAADYVRDLQYNNLLIMQKASRMDPILHIPKLDLMIGNQSILRQFQLSLYRGKCMGLMGESGSGKTMSALSILQLLPSNASVSPDSQIIFHNQNLLDYSEKQMRSVRGKQIGLIFQDAMSAFNPVFTIGQQITAVLRLHLKLSKIAAKNRTLELLREVGISDPERCFNAYAHELSGGQRQRAMIAMAISAEPDVLIADEPTTALDPSLQLQIIELLNELKEKKQCALLFIGHDLSVVKKIADDITVLHKGNLIEHNNAKDFFRNPKENYSRVLLEAVLDERPRKTALIETETVLSVENLKVYFPVRSSLLRRTIDVVKAVDDVSFSVKKGETVALMGESGSGKTTVAKSILQLIKNTEGHVLFGNEDLSTVSSKKLRQLRAKMQIIFQDSSSALDPRMTISDSLCEGLWIQKKIRTKEEGFKRVEELLTEVELPVDLKWRYPHELSGGQRQRVCIARALALSPELLILDEPTSALDVSTQKQILDLLDRLQAEKQLSYLLITHSMAVVAYLAHRVVALHHGKMVE